MDEKQILVSLGDDKVKQIGEVIGNKTCNKILDLLVNQELTPTEISKKLKIPLNTIDYNLKKLVKSGLIENTSNWWSVKGRKIKSYKVSNKKIVISPKKSISKTFLLVLGMTGISGFIIKRITRPIIESIPAARESFAAKAYDSVIAEEMMMAPAKTPFWQTFGPAGWFLFGAWLAILLFFIFNLCNERGKNHEKDR